MKRNLNPVIFFVLILFRLLFPAERFTASEEILAPGFDGVTKGDFFKVLSGQGEVEVRLEGVKSSLLAPAADIVIEAGPKGMDLWIRAARALPADIKQISWWMHSRSLPFFDVKVVLQSPEGKLLLFRAPASGNSPWTRYAWSLTARSEPEKELDFESVERSRGEWRFCGWMIRFLPFAKGSLYLGEVGLSKKELPVIPKTAWSLRDVDLDKIFMGAYTGFRIGYDGLDDQTVPLRLLLNQSSNASIFTWQIATGAGELLDGGVKELVRPGGLDSAFHLPALPVGNYWMRVKVLGASRELTSDLLLSYLVNPSAVTALPKNEAAVSFDAFFLGAGEASFRGRSSDMKTIPIKLDAARGIKVVEWTLRNGRNEVVEEGRLQNISGANETKIAFGKTLSGPERYELTLRGIDGTRLVDQRVVSIDVDESRPSLGSSPFVIPEKRFWLRETDTHSIRADQEKAFQAFAEHAGKNGSQIFLSFNWDEAEPAPGLIQFPILDRRVAEARKVGAPVNLTLYAHHDHLPRWLWYDQMLDQTGQNRHYSASYIRKPTPVSEKTLAALTRTIRSLVNHYQGDEAVVGWNFSQGVESFWSDAARNGYIVDGGAAAEKAFGAVPPVPVFSGELDLRPTWLAWESFKASVPAKYFDRIFSAVREGDKNRPIYNYAGMGAGDLNNYLPVFKKHGAVVSFGAGESTVSAFNESLCRQAGVHLDAESSAVPPYPPTLLLTLFHKLANGSVEGGFNIFWGRFFNPENKEQVDGARTASKWISLIERVGASAPVSSGVAIGAGMRSVVNRSRSFMWIDWVNLNTYEYGDMLSHVISLSAQTPFVTEATPAESLVKHRAILFLEAPLLDEAAGKKLVEYVRNGGMLLLQGDTGRYNLAGEETWHLKKGFGLSFERETPVVFGKGKVAWIKKPIVFRKSKNALKEFFPWADWRPPLVVDHPSVRHALRVSEDGKKYYAVLFGKTWEGGNPSKAQLAGEAIRATARFDALPEGEWSISDLGTGEDLGGDTTAHLSQGLAVTLKPAELKIIKLEKK